ncbi:MAG: outer membrane beta-barrel protein [Bdellovibrio sp.]
MKKILVALAMVLSYASVSQAGWLIEPYLGYEMGKTSSGNVDGKTELVNLGGRFAYTLPVFFWVGLDANIGMSGKYKPDSGSDEDVKRTTLGLVVGFDLPVLLRVWAAYGFSNELKFDDSVSTKVKGNNMKLGVGFTGLPFVSLNLEYIKDDFKDVETSLGNGDADFDHDSLMLSVSLPLEF